MSALGTFVSSEKKGGAGRTSYGNYYQSESREITLNRAKSKIGALAQQLRLRQDHVDMSFYFYKLALSKGMTKGRKIDNVIAACVYITCRVESTSHMLIDFSDALNIDVYELGKTYLKISQALCINIPAMDPCLYVMRYANKLEFEDKTHEVSMTALRLVSRMKKDWIHFGRRPSGLCGAALVIASRLHDFNRSLEDVLKVVKVHESTLRRRLSEFGKTKAASLTVDEFITADLESMTEEMDPPCYQSAKKREDVTMKKIEKMANLENEMIKLERKIEFELEKRRNLINKKSESISCPSDSSSSHPEGSVVSFKLSSDHDDDSEIEKFIKDETMRLLKGNSDTFQINEPFHMQPASSVKTYGQCLPDNFSPGLGLMNSVQDYLRQTPVQESHDFEFDNDCDDELDISGIDEDEIESYLMTPEEVICKTKMWVSVNKDYLKEEMVKRKLEKEEREEIISKGLDPDQVKKKRSYTKKRKTGDHITAVDAIESMVSEKKLSTKINYDVLLNLGKDMPKPETTLENEHQIEDNNEQQLPNSGKYQRKQIVTSSGRNYLSDKTNSKKPKVDRKPNLLERPKRPKVSIREENCTDTTHVEKVSTNNIFTDDLRENEDCDEISDDDKPHMSAAQLMAQEYGYEQHDYSETWGEEEYY